MNNADNPVAHKPREGAIRYSSCEHPCFRCKEKTALCFECWHGYEMDVDYFCTSCGFSWGSDGSDS